MWQCQKYRGGRGILAAKTNFLSLYSASGGSGDWIWTLELRILSQLFYHCATPDLLHLYWYLRIYGCKIFLERKYFCTKEIWIFYYFFQVIKPLNFLHSKCEKIWERYKDFCVNPLKKERMKKCCCLLVSKLQKRFFVITDSTEK